MCLILLAIDTHPRYPLVIAANRDEFYARPTSAARWWEDAPEVLAGRDLRSGGSWMGVTRAGRWAAVTNYRDPSEFGRSAPSRGALVSDFLRGDLGPEAYLRRLLPRAEEFNGFNLLVGDLDEVWWLSNRATGPVRVEAGVHGLSNHLLDTPWPKVERGTRELTRILAGPDPSPDTLLDLLLDRTLAADHQLPETGMDRDRERALSPAFILTPDYGTRASTALLLDRDGELRFQERSFLPGTLRYREEGFDFSTAGS
jgi:uncharacterized protein with NRDE domain